MGLALMGHRIAVVAATALMVVAGGGVAYAAGQGGTAPAAVKPSANLIEWSGTPGPIPNNVDTQLCFQETQSDTGGLTVPGGTGHGCAAGDEAGLRAPVAGEYLLTAGVAWLANSQGDRRLHIEVPGNLIAAAGSEEGANPFGFFTVQNTSTVVPLKAGQIVTVFVFQTSGGPLVIDRGDARVFMSMTKVG